MLENLVRVGDDFGLGRSETLAKALAGLPQELERARGGILDCGEIRISPVLLDTVRLNDRSDFVGRLQGVVDGPVASRAVSSAVSASIPYGLVVLGPCPTSSKFRS